MVVGGPQAEALSNHESLAPGLLSNCQSSHRREGLPLARDFKIECPRKGVWALGRPALLPCFVGSGGCSRTRRGTTTGAGTSSPTISFTLRAEPISSKV
jgi:hypothetical protein